VPVINFSKADILRSQTMEAQWASFEITNITGPTKNDAGDGVNYVIHFTLIDHKNADLNGKEFKRTFSSKAIGMMIPLFAAARGVSINDLKEEFQADTDELKGKKLDGKIAVDIYMGRPVNKVEEYLPYTKGVNMAPAF
jgi:hypothetical protein